VRERIKSTTAVIQWQVVPDSDNTIRPTKRISHERCYVFSQFIPATSGVSVLELSSKSHQVANQRAQKRSCSTKLNFVVDVILSGQI